MQINRLFEIIYILMDKQQITAGELANRFEVSIRTIYRDIDHLSEMGFPVYMDKGKGGGIRLLPDFVLNKTVITKQEKMYILSALSAINAVPLQDNKEMLERIESFLGPSYSDWIEVNFGLWTDGEKEAIQFEQIKQCILFKKVAILQYVNTRGEVTKREVEPLKLVFKGTAWYTYCFCRLRQDYRFFKLKRIREIDVTDETFERVCPNNIWHEETYEASPMIHVKVRFDKESAFLAYDEFTSCELQEDGSVIAQEDFNNEDWVLDHLLSYGTRCEILEPLDLRKKMIYHLSQLQNMYKEK